MAVEPSVDEDRVKRLVEERVVHEPLVDDRLVEDRPLGELLLPGALLGGQVAGAGGLTDEPSGGAIPGLTRQEAGEPPYGRGTMNDLTSGGQTTGVGGAPKVLIVDDLQQNILALQAILGHSKLQLLTANSGPQALEMILRHDIALALIDVQMPEMDGFELAELMRGNERSRHIPIIFLTAAIGDPSRQFRGYEAGAVDFLSKPFDAFVLRSKIEVFVQLHAQKRRLAQKLAELEESLRLNELFTAVLGHDLRSPLASVLANAEILKRLAPTEQISGIADRISASSERMSRMISQILDLARVRAQTFDYPPPKAIFIRSAWRCRRNWSLPARHGVWSLNLWAPPAQASIRIGSLRC
jgi:CheY-like chemotaxis protein